MISTMICLLGLVGFFVNLPGVKISFLIYQIMYSSHEQVESVVGLGLFWSMNNSSRKYLLILVLKYNCWPDYILLWALIDNSAS